MQKPTERRKKNLFFVLHFFLSVFYNFFDQVHSSLSDSKKLGMEYKASDNRLSSPNPQYILLLLCTHHSKMLKDGWAKIHFFCYTIHKKLNKSCFLDKIFLFLKKKIVSLKKTLIFFFVPGIHRGGFQFIVILTPQGVPFHPVVVMW